MLIIEEGTVTPREIKLEMKHRKSILAHWKEFREVRGAHKMMIYDQKWT